MVSWMLGSDAVARFACNCIVRFVVDLGLGLGQSMRNCFYVDDYFRIHRLCMSMNLGEQSSNHYQLSCFPIFHEGNVQSFQASSQSFNGMR